MKDIINKRQYLHTPQFPGQQDGASVEQVRAVIRKQKKTKGFNWSVANGFNSFNLELSGTARVFLGFSLMPVVADAGAISIAAMAEEFNLTINNEIITDQTHPAFYTNFFTDEEYYSIPRPLSGTDIITVSWNNAGAVQNWVLIVYYI